MLATAKRIRAAEITFGTSVALFLTSCSYPARTESMVPPNYDVQNHHRATVKINVEGGQESPRTINGTEAEVSNDSLKRPLRDAINQSGVFSGVTSSANDYELKVTILNVIRSQVKMHDALSNEATVTVLMNWKLTRGSDGQTVWQDVITKSDKAILSLPHSVTARYRDATEVAVRENIKDGISSLSRLKL